MILWTVSLPGQHVQEVILRMHEFFLLLVDNTPWVRCSLAAFFQAKMAHRQVQKALEESETKVPDVGRRGYGRDTRRSGRNAKGLPIPEALEIVGHSESELLDAPFHQFHPSR